MAFIGLFRRFAHAARGLQQTPSKRRAQTQVAAVEACDPRLLLSGIGLTAQEQYLVELINRARVDPFDEAFRQKSNRRVNLDDPIYQESLPPLAVSEALQTASNSHIVDWYGEAISHGRGLEAIESVGQDGKTLAQRATLEGYAGSVSTITLMHHARFVGNDFDVNGRTPAENSVNLSEAKTLLWADNEGGSGILSPDAREIGVAFRFLNPNESYIEEFSPEYAGYALAFGTAEDDRPFITGVAYVDSSEDDFYSPGEGLTAGIVVARDVETGREFRATVGQAGGYSIQVAPNATYTVRLQTPTHLHRTDGPVAVDDDNVKVDFQLHPLETGVPLADLRTLIGHDAETGDWWLAQSDLEELSSVQVGNWSVEGGFTDLVRGDFDGDGQLDVAGRAANGDLVVGLLTEDVLAGTAELTAEVWGNWSDVYTWSDIRVGDFNGDGRDDLIARAAENGRFYVARSNGEGFRTSRAGRLSTRFEWVDLQIADFDGDGADDVAVRNLANGEWWVCGGRTYSSDDFGRGVQFFNRYYGRWSPKATWADVQTGDFNGDGLADIIGRVDSRNEFWVAETNLSKIDPVTDLLIVGFDIRYYGRLSTQVEWTDFTVANFTGDDADDILVRNAANGRLVVGTATDGRFLFDRFGQWSRSVQWLDVQAIDVDADGYADLVGRTDRSGSWWAAMSDGHGSENRGLGRWAPEATWQTADRDRFKPVPPIGRLPHVAPAAAMDDFAATIADT